MSLNKYREIFDVCYNIGFHKPQNSLVSERFELEKEYHTYIQNKNLSREQKQADKQRSKTEKRCDRSMF